MPENILSQINSPADLKKLPMEKLPQLANEIRQKVIEITFKNGGHLGSNLGVIELTIALHYVFNLERDRLIWDVSHQCYTHKILTGRKDRFDSIRLHHGLSGFTNPDESSYDTFVAGHAGTSISTALGIAIADSLSQPEADLPQAQGRSKGLSSDNINRKVIAVCGDGALTAGMNLEALNYAGILKKNIIVILNDNKMSISHTVGAMANYLTKLRTSYLYQDLKKDVSSLLGMLPKVSQQMEKAFHHIRAAALAPLGGAIFGELGWAYFGPIEGHNIPVLINNLKTISQLKGPILLHIITEKGQGLQGAIDDPYKMHGIGPLKVADGKISSDQKQRINYTDAFAENIVELAGKDDKIVGITAAMPDGTGLNKLQEKFPNRYFDVGICEQQAVGLACGMAKAGLKPIVAIYSTFLQRAFDQLFHEIALQKSNVVFALDRAGLVGADGPTHHGLYDIAYCRLFPDFILMAPRDGTELKEMLLFATSQTRLADVPGDPDRVAKREKPVFIRYPRAPIPQPIIFQPSGWTEPIREGKAEILRSGKDGVLLAYGSMVYPAYYAAELLKKDNIELTVVNARFAKPIDEELISQLLKETPFIITLEEHSINGGFGSVVLESVSRLDETRKYLNKIITVGIPDRFIEHGPREKLLGLLGLDVAGIIKLVKDRKENTNPIRPTNYE